MDAGHKYMYIHYGLVYGWSLLWGFGNVLKPNLRAHGYDCFSCLERAIDFLAVA